MRNTLKAIAATLVLSCSGAHAASLILDSNNLFLLGVADLDVNGTLYNVAFEDGSCNSLYNMCSDSDIALPNEVEASDAANALLTQVFSGLSFDDQVPEATFGCEGAIGGCFIRIAHQNGDPSTVGLATIFNAPGANPNSFFLETLGADNDTLTFFNVTTATFTAAVPLPATGWMILAGMAGLIGLKRRS